MHTEDLQNDYKAQVVGKLELATLSESLDCLVQLPTTESLAEMVRNVKTNLEMATGDGKALEQVLTCITMASRSSRLLVHQNAPTHHRARTN